MLRGFIKMYSVCFKIADIMQLDVIFTCDFF